jgi:hypothetical protein
MTQQGLDEKLMNVKGAVTMAYPMGIPHWDTVTMALNFEDGLTVRI